MGGLVKPIDNMKKYIGTKTVQATPAVKKGGKVYLPGDEIPKSMEPSEDGYKVVYSNGYESWCPKDEFEKNYHLAETPVDRMHIEYDELREKSGKLNAYLENTENNTGAMTTWAMLHVQHAAMEDYMQALALRTTLMETGQGGFRALPFASAITLLEKGFAVRREGWNGKGLIVFKQVPAKIDSTIIPKMQSLPVEAKRLILESAQHIDYTSQCLIYNQKTGRADSWVPSISDVFSRDWELV